MNREVVSDRFPLLPIRFRVNGRSFEELGILDTGFEGGLSVPPDLLGEIDSPNATVHLAPFGSGLIERPLLDGVFEIGDYGPFPVEVVAFGDEILIGQAVIAFFTVTLDHGRRITVSA